MAPSPDTATWKYWMKYSHGGFNHEVLFRTLNDIGINEQFGFFWENMAIALKAALADTDAVISGRYSAPGSDISLPMDVPGGAGEVTGVTLTAEGKASFFSMTARGITGREAVWHFYLPQAQSATEYKYARNTLAAPFDDIEDLISAACQFATIVDIDGEPMILRNYVLAGENAGMQRKQR